MYTGAITTPVLTVLGLRGGSVSSDVCYLFANVKL